jgi:RNA polymerase sigma-70 factor (ECF subfamily)
MNPLSVLVSAFGEDRTAQLIPRLKARDPEALGSLYDVYGRLVYGVTLRIVRNPGVAEDLTQEVFLRAWNRAHQLKDDCNSIGPWLLSIARHCALDYRKSRDVRLTDPADAGDQGFALPTIEREILDSERVQLLADAFQILTPNQRRVLELAYFDGLTQPAIAERLKQPLGTVKGWTRVALAKLRQELRRSLAYNQ